MDYEEEENDFKGIKILKNLQFDIKKKIENLKNIVQKQNNSEINRDN